MHTRPAAVAAIATCLATLSLTAAAHPPNWQFLEGVSPRQFLAEAAQGAVTPPSPVRAVPRGPVATANKDYKITLDIEVTNSLAVYHGAEAKPGEVKFKQVSGSKDKFSRVRGEGPFSRLNSEKRETDKTVIGVDIKGESLLSVQKDTAGEPYLAISLAVNDEIDGIKLNFAYAYTAGVEFTRGSWQDLESGLPVELKLTELGEKMAAEGAAAAAQAALRALRDALDEKLKPLGGSAGEVRLDDYRSEGRSTLSGTRKRLEVRGGGKTIAAMSFVISAPF